MTQHVWTEAPLAEIWHSLLYLRSPANVINLLTGRIKSGRGIQWPDTDELRDRADAIASCIRQAAEYADAEQSVADTTRPLLLFYSMESLAKAAILGNDQSITLDSLKYHGLTQRPKAANAEHEVLQQYREDPSQWELSGEFAITNDGVFPRLTQVFQEQPPAKGTVISFRDAIRPVPELQQLYQRHFGETGHAFDIYHIENEANSCEIIFPSEDESQVRSVFPEFEQGWNEVTRHDNPGFSSTSIQKLPGHVHEGAIAGQFLVRAHPAGIHHPAILLFVAMFILSNVVRYKPSFWMKIVQGSISGDISLTESVCRLARRRFVHDVLQHLWQERLTFGAPGYLS